LNRKERFIVTRKGIPGLSFSWKRALGISAEKGRISRAIGIPLTRSGREQKIGRIVSEAGLEALAALNKPHEAKAAASETQVANPVQPLPLVPAAATSRGWLATLLSLFSRKR